jgi:hypothetical protein
MNLAVCLAASNSYPDTLYTYTYRPGIPYRLSIPILAQQLTRWIQHILYDLWVLSLASEKAPQKSCNGSR